MLYALYPLILLHTLYMLYPLILLQHTGPPVPTPARVHSTPPRPFLCSTLYVFYPLYALPSTRLYLGDTVTVPIRTVGSSSSTAPLG
eukprot:778058-Prorocentrum_minimum.AAC.1